MLVIERNPQSTQKKLELIVQGILRISNRNKQAAILNFCQQGFLAVLAIEKNLPMVTLKPNKKI
jgi:hypothetical protein